MSQSGRRFSIGKWPGLYMTKNLKPTIMGEEETRIQRSFSVFLFRPTLRTRYVLISDGDSKSKSNELSRCPCIGVITRPYMAMYWCNGEYQIVKSLDLYVMDCF